MAREIDQELDQQIDRDVEYIDWWVDVVQSLALPVPDYDDPLGPFRLPPRRDDKPSEAVTPASA